MSALYKKVLWVGLIAAIILGALWQFYPLPSAQGRFDDLPFNGLNYKGIDVPLTSFEKEFFKGVNVLKRVYFVDGNYYFVTVLDGTHNRHVVHDPYYCFKGAGWEIVGEHPFKMERGAASLIDLKKEGTTIQAVYWFTDEKEQYDSPLKYWLQTALRRLTLGFSGPEPVLVMVQPKGSFHVDWEKFFESIPPLEKI